MLPASPAKKRTGSRILAQVVTKGSACLVAALLATLAQAADGLKYEVRIDAPSEVRALLEHNLDLVRFSGNERMDREQLQRLVRVAPEQIRTLVATDGYYSPVVSATFDREAAAPVVQVKVEPGEPVRVGEIDLQLEGFTANLDQPSTQRFDVEALKAGWPLKKGEVFRQENWESAKRAILRSVVQTRYPRAQLVDSQATVDPELHQANLRVVIESGPEMRFGELRIEGLKRYPASVISNLNQIHAGDYYSEAALQSYQSRLQDTGYFASVEVSADTSAILNEQLDAAASTPQQNANAPMAPLPLLVRVVENKRKNVSAGLGYSTNTGNRASLTYDDLSVFGLRMKTALTMETKKQTFTNNFYFPVTPDGYNDSIGASFERTDVSGEVTSVASIAGKRTWGTALQERSLTLELLTETKTIGGIPSSQSKSLPLTYGVTWRKLDNLLFPTKGYALNAQLGGALLPVLTDEAFIRGYARGVAYLPLGASSNAIFRAELGALASRDKDGVPSTYLFRAGGDQSVRGYGYQELGVSVDNAITGGRYLATASAEYQYWFKPQYGAAVFYDAGNAGDTFNALRPKSGYGVGARWKSPVGPINVDVAYGHAVHKYRLHFSLGFTF
ncbi:BamA/TamA family outer membrane protein [Duganella sp. FT80W]|uniref:Translocation and assembly module subunit TamA n=1 Tax=Duganella guangzhouensis TaxID=2666084 RepID=A0A6I2LC45_9BURK|nr:autotransporter assembly complex family protein [Duganella guangzhouensis]MRW93829.1 BamA/TamA family outer membrane protein [Duganella guangzhouensis]